MSQGHPGRRLTTILAADVAGYSRLMAGDEEATLARLRNYRNVVDSLVVKHDGRIFNTAGDAMLAEFKSAVEAVRCAVSIQEELAVRNAQLGDDEQMLFRIGINVGDVMVEGDDLFGDGVNVASRLEGLAEAGGICISGSTFEQVKNKLSMAFIDIGAQTVKNIPEPVPAFRIVHGQVAVNPDRPTEKSRTSSKKMPNFKGRRPVIAAVSGLVILLAGFLAWWFLAPPGGQAHAYDGRWQITVHSRSGCRENDDRSYPVTVRAGLINEPDHRLPKKGAISDDGRFTIEVTDGSGRMRSVQEGTIRGDRGQGRFTGARPTCTGSVRIERVN